MNIILAIATAGRREQLRLTLHQIAKQISPPQRVVICPARPEDFDLETASNLKYPIQVVSGPIGLPAQRNKILSVCTDADVVLFIDDDYYPAADYLQQLAELFTTRPDIVISTNQPVLDGATGPGISHEDALEIINNLPPSTPNRSTSETYGGYGCNIAVRMSAVRAGGLSFDERLPLYGWLEDIDFSRRAARFGLIVNHSPLRGVHLGTKNGRTSGLRFGYSQIANPIYMIRKGSMSIEYGGKHMIKHLLKNFLYAFRPEPWVDRRGRLKGNLIALADIVLGRLHPERILQL